MSTKAKTLCVLIAQSESTKQRQSWPQNGGVSPAWEAELPTALRTQNNSKQPHTIHDL